MDIRYPAEIDVMAQTSPSRPNFTGRTPRRETDERNSEGADETQWSDKTGSRPSRTMEEI